MTFNYQKKNPSKQPGQILKYTKKISNKSHTNHKRHIEPKITKG
jgi:hypothetical protein